MFMKSLTSSSVSIFCISKEFHLWHVFFHLAPASMLPVDRFMVLVDLRVRKRLCRATYTRRTSSTNVFFTAVFSPPVKQRQKRNRLFHHLQTTVRPETFHPRLVYDGNAVAYSPGRMDLAGNSGATVRVQPRLGW